MKRNKNCEKKSNQPRHSDGFIILCSIPLGMLLCGLIGVAVCFFAGVFPTPKFVRQLRVKQYSDDKVYSTIVGQAQIRYYESGGMQVLVTPDDVEDNKHGGGTYYYKFISSHQKIIEDNGFKDILSEPTTDKYGVTYYTVTQTVTMTVTDITWGDGMSPFAVAISAGGKEYLSYEIGKEKLLYYFLYEMH